MAIFGGLWGRGCEEEMAVLIDPDLICFRANEVIMQLAPELIYFVQGSFEFCSSISMFFFANK